MLALIYFTLAAFVGDFLCRRFYQFQSRAHRFAAAILVGLVVSSWFTYLVALAFFWTPQPLVWANLLFFLAAIALLSWPKWKRRILKSTSVEAYPKRSDLYLARPDGSSIADWLLIAGYLVLVSWMMFASFNTKAGKLRIANPEYSDFGPNTALIQSFAVGHNFPTEYPHFSGDRIRYHFLFYFQAGNPEFLGFNPAWSLNLLSITTLVSMLVIVMTLGEVLFNSRAVGRLGSLLFFFFGSLSYVPFLQKQASVRAAIQAITHRQDYLPTIFPYRGDAWGTWSQVTYLNQRHFATAIGIFLLVVLFLMIRYRAAAARRPKGWLKSKLRSTFGVPRLRGVEGEPPKDGTPNQPASSTGTITPEPAPVTETAPSEMSDRPQAGGHNDMLAGDARPAEILGDPETEVPPSPTLTEAEQETIPAGYNDTPTDEATLTEIPAAPESEMPPSRTLTEAQQETVLTSETFRASLPGFVFSGVLLGLLPMFNSAVFLAAAAVLGVLFLLFSLRGQMLVLAITSGVVALPQMLYLSTGSGRAQMPKLLHWGYTIDHPTLANVAKYLGFTFGFKWLLIGLALIFAGSLQRRFFLAALSLLAVAFSFQFTIEVLANQKFIHIWVIIANLFVAFGLWRLWHFSLGGTTLPGKFVAAVLFLLTIPGGVIDFFPIHNTGWSEVTYKDDPFIDWLKKETTPRQIFLTDRFVNHPILMAGRRVFYGWPYYSWGAGYDASKRDRVYTTLFESRDPWKVFHLLKENGITYVAFDGAVRQAQFIKRPNEELYATYFPKIFEDKQNRYNSLTIYKVPDKPPSNLSALPEAVSNMFEGGRGTGKGEFDSPTGIAIDPNGDFFVTDTNNGRIEKFSPKGTFLDVIGTKGSGQGQFGAPNGIAIDHTGNIYVADAGNHRVQQLSAAGKLIAEWRGPDVGFYGPRRIAIGPDNSVYVMDQGRTRVVKLSPSGEVLTVWGSKGNSDGQFDDPASVAVDSTSNKVYVADPRNKRIQIFDSDGKFLTKWIVPEWGGPYGFEDLAIDSSNGRLYASSANTNSVLIFDLNGNRLGALTAKPPDHLAGPSGLALADRKLYVVNKGGNYVTVIDL